MKLARRLACGALLAASIALSASGCSPQLKEGTYSCDDGACPTGWTCREDDHLCYSSPAASSNDDDEGGASGSKNSKPSGSNGGSGSAGKGDADSGSGGSGGKAGSAAQGGSDGAGRSGTGGMSGSGSGGSSASGSGSTTPTASYDACDMDTPCSAPETCAFGPDDKATSGACAQPCDDNSECTAQGGRPGLCIGGECVLTCGSKGSCTAPARCYAYVDMPMQMQMPKPACFEVSSPNILKGTRCAPETNACAKFEECIFNPENGGDGLCAMHCDPNTECPGTGACIELLGGIFHCMVRCETNGDCNMPLECGTFAGQKVCIPAAWDGLSVINKPRMMM